MSETEIQQMQKSLTLILKKLELAEKERNDLKEENKVMKESSEKLTEKYLEIEGNQSILQKKKQIDDESTKKIELLFKKIDWIHNTYNSKFQYFY
ncbi:Oidioi.mRNA.OKI2018_I69.chr2.g4983.t1.cds [Oikopleura dioica]|uniref:Oidioi.mRNA.OKI2018_I69.chr2.g4983.t1.cds n=1 Tax=Oikopleura dioica TaxID=34765 RepID=A0ABN7T864_OIKDI|nr:Oidioi.mRNA.OKI2018_I69.chr2.g4983.t1.cds [Oikopleura dioica]